MTSRSPRPVDVYVGERLKLRRRLLGLTQQVLGRTIGVTYQQIQKYEHGISRITSRRLCELGAALDVPVSFFFEGYGKAGPDCNRQTEQLPMKLLSSRQTSDLVTAYRGIEDSDQRRSILAFAKSLARSAHS